MVEINISINLKGKNDLKEFQQRLRTLSRAMTKVGNYMKKETDQNFVREQTPEGDSWDALAPSTLRTKVGRKILTETRALRGGISAPRASRTEVRIRSTDPKGQFHYAGTSKMPARPFIGIAARHEPQIEQFIREHLKV